jgi:transcriptional regulator with XRE-family HTH domain
VPIFDPNLVRAARESRGLSRDQVARAVGRSTSAIIGIERGEFRPSIVTLAHLADVLGVEVGDFFDESVELDPWTAQIETLVRNAPRLTAEQRSRLAALLAGAS